MCLGRFRPALKTRNPSIKAKVLGPGRPIKSQAEFFQAEDRHMLGPDRPSFLRTAPTPKNPPGAYSTNPQLALRQFVARVGGVENARRALEMLALLSRAA